MRTLKLLAFTLTIVSYFLATLVLYPAFLLAPDRVRRVLTRIVSFYSKVMLRILNIKIHASRTRPLDNYLIVSNHLSYIDVLVLSSVHPSCFVTSTDVRDTPFLGHISKLAGCLFVDRKNKKNLRDEIQELRDALQSGLNVIVFPEATSTNGDEVLRFKRPLFESSIATGKAILPLTINYLKISGKQVSLLNRDKVCWYGEMDFFPHFFSLLAEKEIEVEIILSEPIIPELMNTIDLALKSQQKVSQYFDSLNRPAMEAL
jgi:1-acyl-sn-glycerol-3-phosphate acyltransferase